MERSDYQGLSCQQGALRLPWQLLCFAALAIALFPCLCPQMPAWANHCCNQSRNQISRQITSNSQLIAQTASSVTDGPVVGQTASKGKRQIGSDRKSGRSLRLSARRRNQNRALRSGGVSNLVAKGKANFENRHAQVADNPISETAAPSTNPAGAEAEAKLELRTGDDSLKGRITQSVQSRDMEKGTDATINAAKVPGRLGASSFEPDTSLISVLQDMVRAMKNPRVLAKVDGSDQQAVVDNARKILEKALNQSGLASDRIIGLPGKGGALATLKTEAWASGEVEVSDDLRGSLAAVWAKRPNGLINITIAGNAPRELAPNGKKIGQFVVVITGNSSVQTGMDIQSQSDVDFWLGEVQHVAVESECFLSGKGSEQQENPSNALISGEPVGQADLKKKSSSILGTVVTERERQSSQSSREPLVVALKAPETAQASAQTSGLNEITLRSEHLKPDALGDSTLTEGNPSAQSAQSVLPIAGQSNPGGKGLVTENKTPNNLGVDAIAGSDLKINNAQTGMLNQGETPAPDSERLVTSSDVVLKDGTTSNFKADGATSTGRLTAADIEQTEAESDVPSNQIALRTEGPTVSLESPDLVGNSASQTLPGLLLPQRAIAGQPVTVSVLDDGNLGRANIQLNFNGVSARTDESGRAVFTIPEDASPGKTLSVSSPVYPQSAPHLVEVLQPLAPSAVRQAPRIDNVPALTTSMQVLVIDGHNFDGICQHNRLLIDGIRAVTPIASSPLQLKAFIPKSVGPGKHTLRVFVNEQKSNQVSFETFAIEIRPAAKEAAKTSANRVKIRIVGTEQRVRLHVINQTPGIVFIAKGNDLHLTSPGGERNFVVVNMQRLKRGPFRIDAKLDDNM
jgi:hypothetical protein